MSLQSEFSFLAEWQLSREACCRTQQRVVRLIGYGALQGQKLSGSSYWKIPLASLLAFEERRDRARGLNDKWSRDLDAMGAPLE